MSYCSTLLSVAKFYHFLSCVDLVRFSAPLMAVPFSFELSIAVGPFRFLCINLGQTVISIHLFPVSKLNLGCGVLIRLSNLGCGMLIRLSNLGVVPSFIDVDGVGRDCEDYNQC